MPMIWHCLHSYNHIQEKTPCLEEVAALVGLKINKDKTKAMKVKPFSPQTVMLANCPTDKVE